LFIGIEILINNSSTNKKECAMKTLTSLLFFTLILYSSNVAQKGDIGKETVSHGIKLYSISFINSNNGLANSYFGDVLITTNGGKNWKVLTGIELERMKITTPMDANNSWSVDIYCDVMQSIDGGENWTRYPKKKEEHFCAVYFKDENTGWKVAEEFLQKVVNTIATSIRDNNWEQIINVPYKCREYYTDMNTGWSLGWSFNNLVRHNL
jgi:hypothetical protein